MPLTPGTLLGPYQLVSFIGAGASLLRQSGLSPGRHVPSEVHHARVSPPAQRPAGEPRPRAVAAIDDEGLGFLRPQTVRASKYARERDVRRTRDVPPGEFARRSYVEDRRGVAPGDPLQQRRRGDRVFPHGPDCTCGH